MSDSDSHPNWSIPSDLLRLLRTFASTWAEFCDMLPAVPSVHVVLDANIAISDVIWIARRNTTPGTPHMRTAIAELADAGSIVPAAPPTFRAEVERHLPRVARQAGVDLDRAQLVWAEYRQRIRIIDVIPGRIPADAPDADDLPYIWLQEQLGAAGIATRNVRDIAPAGGRPISAGVFIAFRDYSRAATVELTFVAAGASFSMVGAEGLKAFYRLLKWVLERTRSLPAGIQFLLVIAVLVLIATPRLRQRVGDWIRSGAAAAAPVWAKLAPHVETFALHYTTAQKKRPELEEELAEFFQAPRRSTARVFLVRALAAAAGPLPLDDLLDRMRSDGYAPRSADPRPYLRRIMREDPRVVELPNRQWALAGA